MFFVVKSPFLLLFREEIKEISRIQSEVVEKLLANSINYMDLRYF